MDSAAVTSFAPAELADAATVDRQAQIFANLPLLEQLANAVPDVLMVLNGQRQVVFSNQRLADMLEGAGWPQVKGMRPGEVFDCIRAHDSEGGCGASEFCTTCGSVKAALESQEGVQSAQECSILTNGGGAFDLSVLATPFEWDGQMFTIFAVHDISGDKRREALERTFFHDVLNSAGSVSGLSDALQDADADEAAELVGMIHNVSERLVDEIQSQKQLLAAERGELKASGSPVSSRGLMSEVAEMYARHKVAVKRTVVVADNLDDVDFVSDPALLRRILGNMTKNALEATPAGGTVTLSCSVARRAVKFTVHNPGCMPREVQLQVFKRSFSTKGAGRGIGAYSMKLFAEKYLGGSVGFSSSEEAGTSFYVLLPLARALGAATLD